MARPIWKGSISFGLVNIPVSLYSGEQSTDIHFNLLDRRDQAHIRFKRVNEVTGQEVAWENIIKGYEIQPGEFVLLDDKDFESIAVENSKTVEINDFVEADSIEAQYFEKPYYLVPDKSGQKGYLLLRDTLKKLKKVGIAKVVIRTRENLACVRPYGDTLQLILLRFQAEIKEPEEVDFPSIKGLKISERELDIAAQLVEAMSSQWKPQSYTDEYEATLKDYAEKKHKQGDNFTPPEVKDEKPGPAIDLMELLQKSLAQRGSLHTPGAKAASAPGRRPPTLRKTAAQATHRS